MLDWTSPLFCLSRCSQRGQFRIFVANRRLPLPFLTSIACSFRCQALLPSVSHFPMGFPYSSLLPSLLIPPMRLNASIILCRTQHSGGVVSILQAASRFSLGHCCLCLTPPPPQPPIHVGSPQSWLGPSSSPYSSSFGGALPK